MIDDDIFIAIETELERRTECVRQMMHELARDDLVAALDEQLRLNRLGVTSARNAWRSISPAQRRALLALDMRRQPEVRAWATIRNLAARGLVTIGGCMLPGDPVELTEHGRFVLAKGRCDER